MPLARMRRRHSRQERSWHLSLWLLAQSRLGSEGQSALRTLCATRKSISRAKRFGSLREAASPGQSSGTRAIFEAWQGLDTDRKITGETRRPLPRQQTAILGPRAPRRSSGAKFVPRAGPARQGNKALVYRLRGRGVHLGRPDTDKGSDEHRRNFVSRSVSMLVKIDSPRRREPAMPDHQATPRRSDTMSGLLPTSICIQSPAACSWMPPSRRNLGRSK